MTKQEKTDLLKQALETIDQRAEHRKNELLRVLIEDAAPRCMTNRVIASLRHFVGVGSASLKTARGPSPRA